ncbi:hypothetical protein CVV68_00835 [Arthrobacter livingstonensis]|uniref:Uncharacterized protein n=1 Tax=Arthrobacter livingstonensis TaxID=670078 RepID=A0A2V5LDX9_9MICC|nr:hypothetical protein CVV68_00835 [Arthrobacter livingstonensis]
MASVAANNHRPGPPETMDSMAAKLPSAGWFTRASRFPATRVAVPASMLAQATFRVSQGMFIVNHLSNEIVKTGPSGCTRRAAGRVRTAG